ncbi:hypothetical protein TIFTF001_036801 [Ficus carica]|uniref:Bulb-type lectin domain-containing protein n=1 Tax=Ficus carica TaxID=3494 RepID=A0AA88E8R2_FICCA|nr:hypothetical protein TIFTF001_036789 [Ficus carica]GMN67741.1 hypothetical protein TIFTF001_036801 [Ficus carica]
MHTILIRVVHQHGNLVTKNGWNMKAVLSVKGFYCGIYCTGSCRFYFFSIIAVGGGSHNAVWSADTDHPLREDALLQLTRDKGLVLRRSDGTTVWSATNTTGTPVVGMNLTEAGNLVLFDSQSTAVWQSFDHPVDALLVGRRLYKGVFLVYFRQMRTTQDRILAFSNLKCCRRRPKRTESLTSWKTRMKTWKITPNKW